MFRRMARLYFGLESAPHEVNNSSASDQMLRLENADLSLL